MPTVSPPPPPMGSVPETLPPGLLCFQATYAFRVASSPSHSASESPPNHGRLTRSTPLDPIAHPRNVDAIVSSGLAKAGYEYVLRREEEQGERWGSKLTNGCFVRVTHCCVFRNTCAN